MTEPISISIDLDALAESIASRLRTESRGALTVPRAAEYLSLSRSRIYQMIDAGELTAIRSGRAVRVPVSELDGWINRRLLEERGAQGNVRPIAGRQSKGR